MRLTRLSAAVVALGFVPGLAAAQVRESGRSSASADIELGATEPSQVERNAGAERRGSHTRVQPANDPESRDDELRIGLQVRVDAARVLEGGDVDGPTVAGAEALLVPVVAPGARWLEGKLFTGLGLGLYGASVEQGAGSQSRGGFGLSPVATYDVLSQDAITLSVGGWLTFARLGETETCTAGGNCQEDNDDVTAWGLSAVAGVRGALMRGLSLGGEFGWGFLDISADEGTDSFVHGLFGAIVLEATIGI
jgi:opacity protein-like surface antigen